MGMTDDVFSNNTTAVTPQVRHIVFLREPMTRYVSGILYQAKSKKIDVKDSVKETAEHIKLMVRNDTERGSYLDSVYSYLLTPEQHEERNSKLDRHLRTKKEYVARNAQLSIENLMRYNAIVGMTETFPQSMKILQHVMGQGNITRSHRDRVQNMFKQYIGDDDKKAHKKDGQAKSVSKNMSERHGISTGSVMKELSKDTKFMEAFSEYVKYEQMIVDFATDMHQKQYNAVKE